MDIATLGRRRAWPPYHVMEDPACAAIEADAGRRMARLERLYHVGQDNVWDGREVLDRLIAKHGKPRLDPARKEAALPIFSVLLWGELAAWAISADLAERIDDVEAKMAATSQAHDEARHFYVLRDYLRATGEPLPRLGGLGRKLLLDILGTGSLVHKLIGMQLLVESNALSIFRGLVEADIEPVLSELLPYYEKDEARHVGLGVLYLPKLLARLTPLEAARAAAFQLRCVALLISAGMPMRDRFVQLGIEPRRLAERTVKLQDEIVRDMVASREGQERIQGLLNPAKGAGPRILQFVHPEGGEEHASLLHRAALRAFRAAATAADRALA